MMILYVRFHGFSLSYGNRVAAYWEIAAHSAYDMFSQYKYLIVNLVFVPPRFRWGRNFFLIAPFPDHCQLVPFFSSRSPFLTL